MVLSVSVLQGRPACINKIDRIRPANIKAELEADLEEIPFRIKRFCKLLVGNFQLWLA